MSGLTRNGTTEPNSLDLTLRGERGQGKWNVLAFHRIKRFFVYDVKLRLYFNVEGKIVLISFVVFILISNYFRPSR